MSTRSAGQPREAKPDGTKERANLIKLIHVGRRELRMDDETWRAYLQQAFLVESSTQLSLPRLRTALAHLKRCGFKIGQASGEWAFVDTAPSGRARLLRKILMQVRSQPLAVADGQQVAYVEGISRQIAGLRGAAVAVKPLPMCDEVELTRIVQALAIHIKRLQGSAPGADEENNP
jgi:phage gp16-like protein